MKRQLTLLVASLFAFTLAAQDILSDDEYERLDKEKTVSDSVPRVVTIQDIYDEHQAIVNRNFTDAHYAKVWGGRRYFNISYNMSTLEPKKGAEIKTGVPHINDGKVGKFSSAVGISIQKGRNIRLHKKAIGNALQFNLDYTGLDLGIDKYSAEPSNGEKWIYDGGAVYGYNENNNIEKDKIYYIHWNMKKYEVSYGMSFGLSMTIAPFTHILNSVNIHHLKFNLFYHAGYQASVLYMPKDKKSDRQNYESPQKDEKVKGGDPQGLIGWGPRQSMGGVIMYKRIGAGIEHCWGGRTYKNLFDDKYPKEKFKFSTATTRIFLSIRIGKV